MIIRKATKRKVREVRGHILNKEFTFKEFREEFGIYLVVTGTNIEKGTSQYFSMEHTPDFGVSDAIRISISLPYVFKPVTIDRRAGGAFNIKYGVTWVDGGVLNNNPIHAFDHYNEHGNLSGNKEGPQNIKLNAGLLGFRLDESPNRTIDNLIDYTSAFVATLFDNAELGQFHTEQEENQTIALDPAGLQTTNFTPPKRFVRKTIEKSYKTVCEKFRFTGSNEAMKQLEGYFQ